LTKQVNGTRSSFSIRTSNQVELTKSNLFDHSIR